MAEGHCFSLSDAHIWHIPFIFYGWVKVVLLFLIGTSAFVSIDPITNNKEQKLLDKRLSSPINSDQACFHLWWEPHDDHLMQNSCCPSLAWLEYQHSTSCKLGSASTSLLLFLCRPLPPFRRLYRFGFWSVSS